MADTNSYGKSRAKRTSGVGEYSKEMGNTDIEGLERRDIGRDSRGERPAEQTGSEFRYPVYPPGPKETDRWTHMLSIVPKAQPTFCRVVDGAMSGVDIRLRAVGNGVVPSVAAIAFRTLAKNLGLNSLIKHSSNTKT